MLNKIYQQVFNKFSIFAVLAFAAASAFAIAPANDGFAGAQAVSGMKVHVAGTNVEATLEPSEPQPPINNVGKSVWYKFTAVKSRYYSIRTTRDTDFDTHLSIYTGADIANLTFQNSNNNVSLPNRTSVINYYLNEGATVYIRVAGQTEEGGTFAEGAFNLDITPAVVRQSSDFDRDGKTDFSVFRPSDGTWYVSRSVHDNTTVGYENWGLTGDVPVPADWDGNFRTDAAVFRPSEGKWYVKPNGGIPAYSFHFGMAGDVPVPGQYSMEGDLMPAVFRPSEGVWYFANTNDYSISHTIRFGLAGDVPVPADYDPDGRTDIAVFRPSTGVWYILSSTDGLKAAQFGLPGDIPVVADYDGDAISDIALYRPSDSTWYVLRSSDAEVQTAYFGLPTDIPTVGDFNGDGRADYAVFRPSEGKWYVAKPTGVPAQNFNTFTFGLEGDVPVTR
jgi:hypothetical protein